uniref:Dynein regulatory complex subunit 2 n=1 Tax=Otus sunia TaxID=257818 RepID=A0A8C8AFV0_9STRI
MPDKRRWRAAAPMAAEDEVLLLQSRALAEEEAAKRKGEMLTRFLKDKLAKEQRSSTLNLQKLRTQWRAVLREAKAKDLHRDIEILSQTFARVMDCKDSVIEVSWRGGGRGQRQGPPVTPLILRSPWSRTWRRRGSSTPGPCAATCTTSTGCCSSSAAA